MSQTLYKAKVALNTADVKGLAERRVQSDTAFWRITYTVTGTKKQDIPGLYAQSEKDQKMIIELLKESGFNDDEINPGILDYAKREFRDSNQAL